MPLSPVLLGLDASFGFGDRLGLATPGHLTALQRDGGPIRGVFAQQSIREMARTQRTPVEVMRCAVEALTAAGFSDPWGADADHLKTAEDVRRTAAAGFVFYTIDPSGDVDQQADDYNDATLEEKFAALDGSVDWVEDYAGRSLSVRNGPAVPFDRPRVLRAAVKYGTAIQSTIQLARTIRDEARRLGQPFEIELSVDETEQPTSLTEHYIIADQLRRNDVQIVSLAPRFVGDFEKGVDFKGDLAALERSLCEHAAIAAELGPYKLSLHSGSDKLSMYGLLARATAGRYHVKTAGTSYLEALRVLARAAPAEFRRIVRFSRERYETDKATYHVSAMLAGVPAPEDLPEPRQLEQVYLEMWDDVPAGAGFTSPGRQILHCTFGSVLTHPEYGPLLHDVLRTHAALHEEILAEHFGRHLRALRAG